MLEKSADSPMKGGRELSFSHLSQRYQTKLVDSNVFHVKFNSDAGLCAVSLFDGSLQIISTMLGDHLYQVKDAQMHFPITSLAWKPTPLDNVVMERQKLLGACLDGSIIRWTSKLGNAVEHISLNPAN